MVTGLARTPLEIGAGLFIIGVFAAIYHPVGLALLFDKAERPAATLAQNGVWGNLGVGAAPLIVGFAIDHAGWRSAFLVPGLVCVVLGIGYTVLCRRTIFGSRLARGTQRSAARPRAPQAQLFDASRLRLASAIIFASTAMSSVIFQSTTFALPKDMAERLAGSALSAGTIGAIVFAVFAVGSLGQLLIGRLIEAFGPRRVFMLVAGLQVAAFALMPGLAGGLAVTLAFVFMFAVFGQIPINDYMIGRLATPERRASVYGVRFIVSFAVLGASLPFIAWVHHTYGFDVLYRILAVIAAAIVLAVSLLPERRPGVATVPQSAGE
jgi:MFS family permease